MKPKILMVDDEQMIHGRFLLATRGSEVEDLFEFEFAYSCSEAVTLFSKNPFQYALAFVDYQYEKKWIKISRRPFNRPKTEGVKPLCGNCDYVR